MLLSAIAPRVTPVSRRAAFRKYVALMNSNSLSAISIAPVSEVPAASVTSVETFASMVARGIHRRGFHIADAESLDALWEGLGFSPTEKLQRVHSFASDHGWEVASKDKVSTVLFQPAGRRAILPGMWRLCGMN